jgi:hypothetical protein
MNSNKDIPKSIPIWLEEEYLKWADNPRRYETLYSISAGIIKKYLENKDEKSKERPSKQSSED